MADAVGALPQFNDPNANPGAMQGPQYNTGMQQAAPAGANAGYAVGGLYDSYERARMAQVTNATAMNKAARERVSQIWEMGSQNPAMQQDPRVKGQIDQLYRQMGMPTPVINGNIDWNALRPAQQLSDLSPSAMTMLSQATPENRRAMGHSLGLVGVGDEFYNAPAQLTASQRTAVLNDYSKMIMGGGAKGMSASSFQNWVETNRNNLEQAVGPGAADSILNDPNLFHDMQQEAVTRLERLQAQTAQIKGLPAVQASTIARNLALAKNSTSMSDLAGIRGDYINAQITALPQQLQDKHAATVALIQQRQASSAALTARASAVKTSGSTDTRLSRDLQVQVQSDTAIYNTAQRNFAAALANGDGVSVPFGIQKAVTDAKQQLDQDKGALRDYNSSLTQNTVVSNRAANVSGVNTQPAGRGASNYTFKAEYTGKDGRKVGKNAAGTAWVYADGSPYKP